MRYFVIVAACCHIAGCGSLAIQDFEPQPEVVAVNADSWPLESAWTFDADAGFGPSPLILVGRHLLVANRRGEVVAVERSSGKRAGDHEFGASVEGAPLVHGSMLIVPVKWDGPAVQAYELGSGKPVWTYEGEPVEAGLLMHRGLLVAAGAHGSLTALDPMSGRIVWQLDGDGAAILARPVGWRESILTIDSRGLLREYDAATGEPLSRIMLPAPVETDPLLLDGALIVSTTRGRLLRVDLETRAMDWVTELAPDHVRLTSPAAMDSAVVVAASDGSVSLVDAATGAVRWRADVAAAVTAAPKVVGGWTLIGTTDGRILRLENQRGEVVEEHELRGRVKSAIAVDDGGVYVAVEPSHVQRLVWRRR